MLSLVFLSVMLPVPLTMVSLKVATRFAPTATPVALSAGLRLVIVGAVVSATVAKFQVVSLVMPAKLLLASVLDRGRGDLNGVVLAGQRGSPSG